MRGAGSSVRVERHAGPGLELGPVSSRWGSGHGSLTCKCDGSLVPEGKSPGPTGLQPVAQALSRPTCVLPQPTWLLTFLKPPFPSVPLPPASPRPTCLLEGLWLHAGAMPDLCLALGAFLSAPSQDLVPVPPGGAEGLVPAHVATAGTQCARALGGTGAASSAAPGQHGLGLGAPGDQCLWGPLPPVCSECDPLCLSDAEADLPCLS